MWVKSVYISNVKSFAESGIIELSKGINVLVGANNSGKSTILRSIQLLQPTEKTPAFFANALRIGTSSGEVLLHLVEPNRVQLTLGKNAPTYDLGKWSGKLKFIGRPPQWLVQHEVGNDANRHYSDFNNLPVCFSKEPENFIYPYFGTRKTYQFNHAVGKAHAETVEEFFQHLPSKVDRLSDPDDESFQEFRKACERILGFVISCDQWANGKHVGLRLKNRQLLVVNEMGEGTIQIVSFLVHLCIAKGNLFLIEDIEDDLHPKALKALLEYVIEKSAMNQFVVCTHNNIVTKYLGGAPEGKLFTVEMHLDAETKLPTSTCSLVSGEAERIRMLKSIGYEAFDSFLHEAYLFLEESTAERLIRDFFVPYIVPKLQGKLRTIAAYGVSDVVPRVSDFTRLFVFVHQIPIYNGRAWVALDSGVDGAKVTAELKQKFPDWPESHFRLFSQEHFERYYPNEFQDKATTILKMEKGLEKQKAKGELAVEVLTWALADKEGAKKEFSTCAKDVLDILNEIASKLT